MKRLYAPAVFIISLFCFAFAFSATAENADAQKFVPPSPPPGVMQMGHHNSDAPLLSNDPLVPSPSSMPSSDGLPAVSSLPGVASPTADSSISPSAPFLPPPPTNLSNQPQSSPSYLETFGKNQSSWAQEQSAPSGRALTPQQANALRLLGRGLTAFRILVENPKNNTAIREVMNLGRLGAEFLGLAAFPKMPRFYARFDETVIRKRSSKEWEYRKYGAFQSQLDGYVRLAGNYIQIDLKFAARGHSYLTINGAITAKGTIDGLLTMEGCDELRRMWSIKLEASDLLLRDDGLPSGGSLTILGKDPSERVVSLQLDFPINELPQITHKKTRRPLNSRRAG